MRDDVEGHDPRDDAPVEVCSQRLRVADTVLEAHDDGVPTNDRCKRPRRLLCRAALHAKEHDVARGERFGLRFETEAGGVDVLVTLELTNREPVLADRLAEGGSPDQRHVGGATCRKPPANVAADSARAHHADV